MRIKVWSGYFYGRDDTTVYLAETEDRLFAVLADVAAQMWTGEGDLKERARSEVPADASDGDLHTAMVFLFNDEEGDQYFGTSDFSYVDVDLCEQELA